tara:strand:- start:40 stop:600 length:561 start_codon:yes stop_codon:yes gene_type:complete
MFWNHTTDAIEKAIEVCEAVGRGDFEARLTGSNTDTDIGRLYLAINNMIDRADAYVRESKASLEYVSHNKYFRRIQEKGMLGSFQNASRTINQAMEAMSERVEQFSTVVNGFEMSMENAVGTVSSAATELQSSAEAMDRTAQSTNEQSATVAAAAEQASVNVETVASAAEELSSSIGEVERQVQQA